MCARYVGDELRPVLRKNWSRRIRRRDRIVFIATPLGGGGGGTSAEIGSIVALVALAAFAPWAAGALLGAGGLGLTGAALTIGTSLLAAVIVAGGAYLISHFLGAGKGAVAKPVYSVEITANQARSQQPIPCQHGRLKFFPDLAAPIYSDYSGIDQIFHALYCLGVGEYEVQEIGIGLTPVWTAAGGVSAGFPNFSYEIVEPGADCTLFPTNVTTSDNVSGQQLPDAYGSKYSDGSQLIGPLGQTSGFNYVGPFITNPSGTLANRVAVDLLWPAGCFTSGSSGGDTSSCSLTVDCLYQYVDDSGVPYGSVITGFHKTYTFNSKTPVRITEFFDLPVTGRVQVKVARSGEANSGQNVDSVAWGALKAYVVGPNAIPNVTRLAVRILADKQLSNYSAQQIYVRAVRKLPVWDGTSLTLQSTRNPMWAALDVWTNDVYGPGLSINDVDLITFKALADAADARGDSFDFRFVAQTTVVDALTTVLKSILAAPTFVWDRLTAVRDEPRTLPALVLNDFNIVRGSLSVNYVMQDEQTSDGTIVEYFDENTWNPAEVRSVDDGVDLLRPARVKADGITNRRQAAVFARYLAASTVYRRKTATLTVEAEGKLVFRGSQVAVQSELPLTWGSAFRVEEYDVGAHMLTVHADADWSSPSQHYVRIRLPGGAGFGPVKCSRGGADDQVFLDPTDLALVETQQSAELADVLARTSVEEPPTLSMSVAAPQEFLGLVTGLTSAGEGLFSLTLVYDAPQVYDIYGGSVPSLPTPSPIAQPTEPGVIDPISAYLKQVGVTVTLYASWTPDPASQTYTAQVSSDGGATWVTAYANGVLSSFQVPGLSPGTVLLQIRGQNAAGLPGPWSQLSVVSPEIDYQPRNLGYTVGWYDVEPDANDPSVADEIIELQSVVGAVQQTMSIFSLISQVNSSVASVSSRATAIATDTAALADLVTAVTASVGAVSASVTDEATARSSADSAISTSLSAVSAMSAAGTASGAISWVAQSSLATGVSAGFDVKLTSSPFSNIIAGLSLELLTGGTARCVITASQFQIQDPSTRFVPFAVTGGFLYLQGTTFISSTVKSQTVTTAGSTIGQAVLQLDFVNGTITLCDNS